MSKSEKPRKPKGVKAEKQYTRAQAERMLSAGADPAQFTKHANWHVRSKAFKKMGYPFPEDATERAKLCASLHIKDPNLGKENVDVQISENV